MTTGLKPFGKKFRVGDKVRAIDWAPEVYATVLYIGRELVVLGAGDGKARRARHMTEFALYLRDDEVFEFYKEE